MRIAPGEFEFPSDGPPAAVVHARAIFLSALADVAPNVLDELARTGGPIWRQVAAPIRAIVQTTGWAGLQTRALTGGDANLIWLRDELLAWADTFGFTGEEWILDVAVRTLSASGASNPQSWDFPEASKDNPVPPAVRRFAFNDPGWDVAKESEPEVRARIEKRFTRKLKWYLKRMKQLAAEAGGLPVSNKRRAKAKLHSEWLIRWQVQRWTKAAIADYYFVGMRMDSNDGTGTQRHTGVRTISRGIAAIATALEWKSVRIGEPGAPRI